MRGVWSNRKGYFGRGRRAASLAAVFVLAAAVFAGTGCGRGGESQGASGDAGASAAAENGSAASSGEQKDSVIVVMTVSSEPEAGFDPAYGWGAGEHVHEPLIQSTLTVTKQDLTIGYDLATDMEVSEDGMVWTVAIRQDAVFTDGEPLTAEDVAFTYNTLKETSSVNDFTMLQEAVAVDEKTVEFYLNRPYSIWPYTMAVTGIVPEHAYGADYGMHPIGSGRYVLKQWDKGQQVILEANPDYYGEAPKMKRVTILFMDEDAAFAAVKAGQADLAYTAATYSDQTVDGYELLAFESVDNRGFNLPAVLEFVNDEGVLVGNDFTADVRVRRAISLAIDREELIEQVLNGYGSPAYSVCDKLPWYNPASETSFDPEEAKQLLTEAGWLPGGESGKEEGNASGDGKEEDGVIREKDGKQARLEILYPASDSVRQAFAAGAANQLKRVGIDASIRGTGWDTAYDEAQSQPLMWGWGAHTPMELYNIYHTVEETGLAAYSPYTNETVDRYMDEALAASDPEESYELWKKAQWDGTTGVTEQGDAAWVWLANLDHLYWSREGLRVAEQKLHPHGHGWSIVNNVDQWEWE